MTPFERPVVPPVLARNASSSAAPDRRCGAGVPRPAVRCVRKARNPPRGKRPVEGDVPADFRAVVRRNVATRSATSECTNSVSTSKQVEQVGVLSDRARELAMTHTPSARNMPRTASNASASCRSAPPRERQPRSRRRSAAGRWRRYASATSSYVRGALRRDHALRMPGDTHVPVEEIDHAARDQRLSVRSSSLDLHLHQRRASRPSSVAAHGRTAATTASGKSRRTGPAARMLLEVGRRHERAEDQFVVVVAGAVATAQLGDVGLLGRVRQNLPRAGHRHDAVEHVRDRSARRDRRKSPPRTG